MIKYGWWFAAPEGKLSHCDGRIPTKGVTHEVDISERTLELCSHGLHASEKLLDAVKRAQSSVVYRVMLDGNIIDDGDMMCAQRRTYLTDGIDISSELLKSARMFALDVIDLWYAPEVVRQWLETGDDQYREAAWSAASAWSVSESAEAAEAALWAAWSAAAAASWSPAVWWSAWAEAWSASAAAWAAEAADNKPFAMAMNRYNDTLTQLVLDAHPELKIEEE
jgi:hypothetical protein